MNNLFTSTELEKKYLYFVSDTEDTCRSLLEILLDHDLFFKLIRFIVLHRFIVLSPSFHPIHSKMVICIDTLLSVSVSLLVSPNNRLIDT